MKIGYKYYLLIIFIFLFTLFGYSASLNNNQVNSNNLDKTKSNQNFNISSQNSSWTPWTEISDFKNETINTITGTKNGNLVFVGVFEDGLWEYNINTNKATEINKFSKDSFGYKTNVNDIFLDENAGIIFVILTYQATNTGHGDGTVQNIYENSIADVANNDKWISVNSIFSFNNDEILSINEDYAGNIFIGTNYNPQNPKSKGGLYEINSDDEKKQIFYNIKYVYSFTFESTSITRLFLAKNSYLFISAVSSQKASGMWYLQVGGGSVIHIDYFGNNGSFILADIYDDSEKTKDSIVMLTYGDKISGIYSSNDGGKNWTLDSRFKLLKYNDSTNRQLIQTNDNTLYWINGLSDTQPNVQTSTDYGQTWQKNSYFNEMMSGISSYSFFQAGNCLLMGSNLGLFVNTSGLLFTLENGANIYDASTASKDNVNFCNQIISGDCYIKITSDDVTKITINGNNVPNNEFKSGILLKDDGGGQAIPSDFKNHDKYLNNLYDIKIYKKNLTDPIEFKFWLKNQSIYIDKDFFHKVSNNIDKNINDDSNDINYGKTVYLNHDPKPYTFVGLYLNKNDNSHIELQNGQLMDQLYNSRPTVSYWREIKYSGGKITYGDKQLINPYESIIGGKNVSLNPDNNNDPKLYEVTLTDLVGNSESYIIQVGGKTLSPILSFINPKPNINPNTKKDNDKTFTISLITVSTISGIVLCCAIFLISNKFYRLLKKNKL